MKFPVVAATLLFMAAGALAGEVYKTTDAQGRPIYTDKPPSLPAEKLNVQSATTDTVAVQQRYEAEMKQLTAADQAQADAAKKVAEAKQAGETTAADRSKRCVEARQRYESYMNARRIYEPGSAPDERRYLSSQEMDAARANAKQAMDEFCGSP